MTASIHTGPGITPFVTYDRIDHGMEETLTLALSMGVDGTVGSRGAGAGSCEAGAASGSAMAGEFWDAGKRLENLESLYKAVRPILTVVATLQLIPQQWRIVLGAFIAALDALIASQQQKPAVNAMEGGMEVAPDPLGPMPQRSKHERWLQEPAESEATLPADREPFKAGKDLFREEPESVGGDPFKAGKDLGQAKGGSPRRRSTKRVARQGGKRS